MDKNRLGMILFLGSESVFFALLILAYGYFRTVPEPGPTAAGSLDPLLTGIFSLFLFASSLTIWFADRDMRKGNRNRFLFWQLMTILFGLIFLSGQGYEWRNLILNGTMISTNLFGTTFFTLTGFHGLHVIIGLIMLSIVLGMTLSGRLTSPQSADGVFTISLYWHFVDAVWVVIFSLIYLTIVFA
jgi:heme/copper-type cytochrome/quinol oxidase subunit 3